ncbi:MAG: sulfite exporter TauE/SafE family protein [Syntrophaceae bacterium]|nr:sulfite exporter TauE/SafE family protein [Syntrophaceae bacterium]
MSSLLVGLAAGFLGGLVGIGGGVFMIPLMTEVLKFRQQVAQGMSLVAVVFAGLVGTIVYGVHGYLDLPTAAVMAVMALLTVRLGARYSCVLPEWRLKRYFGVLLLCCFTALLIVKPFLPGSPETGPPAWVHWAILVLLGAMTGFISGMLGVGGGIFMVPMLVLFAAIPQHVAQGTSLLVMIPGSALGAWTYWQRGHVLPRLLPGLVAGVIAGGYGGASVAHLFPDLEMRIIFSLMLFGMAIRYLRTPKKKD